MSISDLSKTRGDSDPFQLMASPQQIIPPLVKLTMVSSRNVRMHIPRNNAMPKVLTVTQRSRPAYMAFHRTSVEKPQEAARGREKPSEAVRRREKSPDAARSRYLAASRGFSRLVTASCGFSRYLAASGGLMRLPPMFNEMRPGPLW